MDRSIAFPTANGQYQNGQQSTLVFTKMERNPVWYLPKWTVVHFRNSFQPFPGENKPEVDRPFGFCLHEHRREFGENRHIVSAFSNCNLGPRTGNHGQKSRLRAPSCALAASRCLLSSHPRFAKRYSTLTGKTTSARGRPPDRCAKSSPPRRTVRKTQPEMRAAPPSPSENSQAPARDAYRTPWPRR